MAKKGALYLIPTYLSEGQDGRFIADDVKNVIKKTHYYLVENVRTARRYISSLKLEIDISTLQFEVLDKKTQPGQLQTIMKPIFDGNNLGVISEAGLPGLADPGHLAVAYCHQHQLQVYPLPGATSIHSAVISSGFSGQQYTFHGYLPIDKAGRTKRIKQLESDLQSTRYTQVFMETPYRNNQVLEDLINTLNPQTILCVASDLFGQKQLIRSMPIKKWKSFKVDLHKIPTVFCIGHFH